MQLKLHKTILVLSVAIFFLPTFAQAAAGPQVIIGGRNGSGVSGATYGIQGFGGPNNTGIQGHVFPVSGTLSNFIFCVDTAPGGVQTRTGKIHKNTVASALSVTIDSASTCSTIDTDSVAVVAGDHIDFRDTNTGSPASAHLSWSVVFTPTVSGETVILGGAPNGGLGVLAYVGSVAWSTGFNPLAPAIASQTQVIPTGGTIDTLYASTTNIQAGQYLVSLIQNSATSTIQCTITAANCTDVSNSISVVTGDTIASSFASSSIASQGPKVTFKGGFGVRFVPTSAGDFIFQSTTGNNADTANATRYQPIVGTEGAALLTAEASTTAPVAAAMTFTSMQLLRSAAPGAAKNATITLRVNQANSSLTCTLTGTGSGDGITTKTCTGSVAVVAGDLVDLSIALDSGGTTGTYRIGLVANANTADAATAPVPITGLVWSELLY